MTRISRILLCLALSILSVFAFASCGLFGGNPDDMQRQVVWISVEQDYADFTTNSSLDDIRDHIYVYAEYDNGDRELVEDYIISGEFLEGSNLIEITYEGCSTTISIFVSHSHSLTLVEEKAGTCLEEGNIEYWICSSCGDMFLDEYASYPVSDVVVYGDHTYEIIPGVKPTCTQYGLTEGKRCTLCDYEYESQYMLPPAGHTPKEGEYCTEAELCKVCGVVLNGFDHTLTSGSCVEHKECINCPYVSDEYGEHDIVTDITVSSTCTESGLTQGAHCSICSEVMIAQEKIPAKGHNYRLVSETAATCTENGLKVVSCTVCKNEVTKVINAGGHNVLRYDEELAPTCDKSGKRSGTCSSCNEYITIELSPLGHIAGDFIFEDGYCGEQRLGYFKCTVCDVVLQEFGHTYKTEITDPTCTEDGKKVYTCTHCNNSYSEAISALGHTHGEWLVITDSTCSSVGSKALYCAFCNAILESREVEIKAHNYESELSDTGITYTCTLCSDSYFVATEQSVTVSFVTVLDGVTCAPLSVNKGHTAVLPVLKKEGYQFNGWCFDDELKLECKDSYVFNEDMTLYASWSVVTVEGSASSQSIVTGVPLDFTFLVTSTSTLTDSNLNKYISIEDIEGRSPKLYISSIDDGVYTIASDEYLEGMSYEVVVSNGVSLVGIDGNQLMFVTESENSTNVVYKDEVVFVSESDVLTVYEDIDGKIYFFLRKDLLDAGDIAIVYGEDINDIRVTMKIVAEGSADNVIEGAFIYEIESVDADEVFSECNIYYSGIIDTDNLEFSANLEEEIIEAVEQSSLYAQLEHTARQYAKGTVIGKYYYEFSRITVNPTFYNNEENKTVEIGIAITSEFQRLHTETREVDSILAITFNIKTSIQLSTTVDIKNLDNFSLILNVDNKTTVDFYVSSGSKYESKKELSYFKEIFLKAREEGSFDELDNSNATNTREIVFGRIMFSLSGINFNFDISNVFNFEVVGQLGMKSVLNLNIQAGIQSRDGNASVVKSFNSNAYLDFYMMGKLRVCDTIKIHASASFLGIVNAYIDFEAGPYFEMGGAAMISISSGGGVKSGVGGYVEMGILLKSNAGVSAEISYWSLFRGWRTVVLYDETWTLLNRDVKIFKIGDKLMTLYFADVKEEVTLEYFCGQKLALSDFIDRTVVMQNLSNMGKENKVADAQHCVYTIIEAPSYVTLSKDGVLSFKMDSESIFIVVELRYGNIHKTVEITINVQHHSTIYEGYAPTCTEIGYKDGKWCSGCSAILEDREIIPAAGHSESEPVSENIVPPTCTEQGCYDEVVYCSTCNAELGRKEITVDAEGHTEKTDFRVEPTCIESGLTEGKRCPKCDHIFIAQQIIPALGHTEQIDPAIAPTCTESGLKEGSHCSVCYLVFIPQAIDYPLGHNYQDDVCTRCGTGETSDKLAYRLSSDGKYYMVNGIGECTDANLVIPSTYNGLPVESISASAFKNCTSLKSVTLPSSITVIGDYAFYGCSNMTIISIPNGVTSIGNSAIYNCTALKSVTIPDSVTTIGESAFRGCTGLVKLVIGEGVTSIGKYAFYNCGALEELNFNAVSVSNFNSDNYVFYNAGKNGNGIKLVIGEKVAKIPAYMCSPYTTSNSSADFAPRIKNLVFDENGVCTSIGNYAFFACSTLADIQLSNSIKSIGDDAFYKCTSLTSVVIPESVTSLGMSAFYGCTKLTDVVLSEAITVINNYTFHSCSSLTNIDLPDNLTTVSYQAFYNCTSLADIALPSTLNSVGKESFYGCSALTEITIPDSVTDIGEKAFYTCSSLATLTIGKGVRKIGGYAFHNCGAIEEIYFNATAMNSLTGSNYIFTYAGNKGDGIRVVIGANVTTIPSYLFYPTTSGAAYLPNVKCVEFEDGSECTNIGAYSFFGMSGLKSITIPANVTNIGTYAFSNCKSLEEIIFKATAMKDLLSGNYVFTHAGQNANGIKVTIGKNVTKIPDYLFSPVSTSGYAPKITSVVFEDDSVCTSIGVQAFYYSTYLTSINLPQRITNIGTNAFYNCTALADISIPESVTSIGTYAFYNCSGIASITIPEGVTKIEAYTFWKCSGIKSISIATSVTEIATYAFSGCESLTSVIIPDSVSIIGNNAFSNCTSLESLSIGKGVVSIGTYAFSACTALEEIYFTAVNMNNLSSSNYVFSYAGQEGNGIDVIVGCEVTKIPAYFFTPYTSASYSPKILSVEFEEGSVCTIIGNYAFSYLENLTEIVIPDSVTDIGNHAFDGCGLTSIALGNSISSIGEHAFAYCEKINSILLPDSVTTIGAYAFSDCTALNEIVISESLREIGMRAFSCCISLTEIVIPDSVTTIGAHAFRSCSALTSVTIGKGVSSIGNYAFYECYELEKLNFNAVAVNNFADQNNVFAYVGQDGNGIEVVIGNEVTKLPAHLFSPYTSETYSPKILIVEFEEGSICESIGAYAFYNCELLASISIPDSVTDIGDYAFRNCTSLVSISLGSSLESIGNGIFYNCYSLSDVTIPVGVTAIGNYAFYCCEALSDITVPDSVTTVGSRAFYGCISLADVTIGTGVTSIGNHAFYNCEALEEIYFNSASMADFAANNYVFAYAGQSGDGIKVVVGDKVTKIPAHMFNPYTSNSAYIPKIISLEFEDGSVCESIGAYAFYMGKDLSAVSIPDSVTTIGLSVFSGCSGLSSVVFGNGITAINADMFSGCSNLESITLGNGVTSIGTNAFYNCSALKSVILGDSLNSIGNNAFYGCESLTEIVIPDAVSSIGTQAFYGCTGLKSLTIGKGITSVSNYAFYNCEKLEEIYFNAISMNDLGTNNCVFAYAGQEAEGIKIVIGSEVTKIPAYIFSPYSSNANLVPNAISIEFAVDSVCKSIGSYAFYGNESITSIVLPDSLEAIEAYAFSACNGLTEVIIPDGVISIDTAVFRYCDNLTSITIPFVGAAKNGSSNTHFGYIFGAGSYSNNNNYVPKSLATVVITGSDSIGDYAFYNCSGIISVTIPDSIITIGKYAFYGCRAIEEIHFNATAMGDLSNGNNVFSYAGQDGNGINVIVGENVTKIPAYLFYPYYDSTYSPKLINVEFKEGSVCDSIGEHTFSNCSSLISINIPDNITRIGGRAFYYCTSLADVVLPDGLLTIGYDAFMSCKSLTSIVIPDSVTSISWQAFDYCTSLSSVTIGKGITDIGTYAFRGCSNINEVHITDLAEWCNISFSDSYSNPLRYADNFYLNGELITELVIPDSVTEIKSCAFYGLNGITSVIIPSSVTTIGSSAFSYCANLKNVTIQEGVANIGNSVFFACTSLASILIPDSVTSIGNSAFYNCTNLSEATIGNGVVTIGYSAFSYTGLENIIIPDSVTSIGDAAFYNCPSLAIVTLGEGLTAINPGTFRDCPALKSVVIPDSVKTIGENAFIGCIALTSVTFGKGLTDIGETAFSGCTALNSIILPDTLVSIGNYAFDGCSAVEIISIGENTVSIGRGAFSGCTDLKIINFNAIAMNDLAEDNYAFSHAGQNGDGIKFCIGSAVTKIPAYFFYPSISDSDSSPKIVSVDFGDDGVCKSIGDYAFFNCTTLTDLSIGISISVIGEYAFSGCTALERISFNAIAMENMAADNNVFSLAGQGSGGIEVTIGDSVTKIPAYLFYPNTSDSGYLPKISAIEFSDYSVCESIGTYAFFGCDELTSIVVPESVISIGISALEGCTSLTSITLPFVGTTNNANTYTHFGYIFGANSYSGNSTYVPESLKTVIITGGTSIGNHAFYFCRNLESITIPDGATNIGNYAFYNCESLTSITIPDSVTSIGGSSFSGCTSLNNITIGNSVTSIGDYAFYECSNLTDITIPDGVTSIGGSAFYGCTSLNSITVGNSITSIGDYAFNGCTSLTSITIPVSVTSIGYYAFNGCSSLTDIRIPDSVTNIGSFAFYGCSSLNDVYITDIAAWCSISFANYASSPLYYASNLYLDGEIVTELIIPDGIITIPEYAFSCTSLTSITIPDSVISIGNSAFYGCSNLTSVTVGNGVTSIGGYVFYHCSSLTSITIPDTVSSIGDNAFGGCSSLTGITIPNSVSSIGSSAFNGCTSLNSITIGNSVTSIGGSAFYGCTSLTSITIGNSVTSIGGSAFYGCTSLTSITIPDSIISIGNSAFRDCSNLTSITIPDSVTSIGSHAFYGCSNLTDITIPDSVTSIGSYAFSGCSGLTDVIIGNGVTSISSDAFRNCTSLVSITIPDSVTSIGSHAFYGCSNLTDITIPDSITSIGDYAFNGCANLKNVYIEDLVSWCNISFSTTSSNPLYYADNLYLNGELGTELVIPSGVTTINPYSFFNLSGITSVVISDGVIDIGTAAFANCSALTNVVISDSVTVIGLEAFSSCDNLTSVIIGNGVTEIGARAFWNCTNLTDVIIGDSVTAIDFSVFTGCTKAREVENGIYYIDKWVVDCDENLQGVVSIREGTVGIIGSAFSNCQLITEIVIPDSVKSISDYAFNNCTSLTDIKIPDAVKVISVGTFANCTKLISITIPYGVTSIGRDAFYKCTSLTSIVVPDSVTEIGGSAFYGCSKLTSITLPFVGQNKDGTGNTLFGWIFGASIYQENYRNVPTSLNTVVITGGIIDTRAFYNCSSIKNITIGSGVKRINANAFDSCYNLNSVTFQNTSGWQYASSATATSGSVISASYLNNTSTAATYLRSTYCNYYWFKN